MQQHTGNVQPAISQDEHFHPVGQRGRKAVTLIDQSGIEKRTYENYEFMGTQTAGDYKYFGFKQNGGTAWRIMRQNTADDSAWQYAYSSDGGNDWDTAWASPGDEGYDDPPDS